MLRRSNLLMMPAALLVLACSNDDAAPGWTTRVDTLASGAVRVVNTPPPDDKTPTWTLEETLRIGSVDGEGPATFGQVKGIAPLDDGGVAVLDAQAHELRIFDADGRHRATWGGQGGGPGEFESAYGLMRAPDGLLWVPDHRSNRMSVFDPDDGFAESYPLTVLSWGFVWDGAMDEDGRVYLPSISTQTREPLLRVYDETMTLMDSLPMPDRPGGDVAGFFEWQSPNGSARGFMTVPFFAQPRQHVTSSGSVWSSAAGSPHQRLAHWQPGGDTMLVIETTRSPIAVTSAERDSAIAAVNDRLSDYGVTHTDWSQMPATKPAVLRLFTDNRDRLWVEHSSPDGLRRFDIYEADGRLAGTLATDLAFIPWMNPVVRGDTVWGMVTDEMEVPYVVRAEIVGGSAAGAENPQ